MSERDEKAMIAAGTRRVVGIAALRRIRRLVDDELATEAANARASRILLVVFAVAALLLAAWYLR